MSYSNDNPVPVERHMLSTAVVSVASTVLALVAFGAGVAMVIAIEVNDWPVVSLLVAAGMWILGVHYLVLADDLREIHRAETSSVSGHVKTQTDERDDAESLAA